MKLNNLLISYASLIHYLWAAILLISPDPLMATPLSGLNFGNESRLITASILFVVATLAFIGTKMKHSLRSLLFLIPQQTVLFIMGFTGLLAAMSGHYADGTIKPSLFILSDQLPAIMLGFIYTMVLIDKFKTGFHKEP